jgi:hypothetical protein
MRILLVGGAEYISSVVIGLISHAGQWIRVNYNLVYEELYRTQLDSIYINTHDPACLKE